MNMKKKMMGATLLLGAFLVACDAESVGENGDEADTLHITAIFEQSGAAAAYGTSELHGVQLAVEEINEAGGVDGVEIELEDFDTQSEETEAAQLATRAASDGAHVIVGPATSGSTVAAISSANDAEVPLITPSATNDEVTVDDNGEVHPYIFRAAFQDSFQGVSLANFAADSLEAETAVILGDNSSDYAVGLMEAFEETFSGEIVTVENFTAGDTDFSAVLTSLSNEDFDVLFAPGYYEETGLIIRQARELGLDQPILGPNGFGSEDLLHLAEPENVTNVFYSSDYAPESDNPRVEEFIEAFRDMHGEEPDMFAAQAYDAVYLVAAAVEESGEVSSEAIRDGLQNLEDFEGVTGTFSFDEFHNPIKSATVIELQEGEAVNYTDVEPD